MTDPIDLSSEATQVINVYVTIKRNPASSAAEILNALNALIDPRGDDSIDNTTSDYVTDGVAYLLGRSLISESGGDYSIVAPYIRRNGGETNLEAVADAAGLVQGTFW